VSAAKKLEPTSWGGDMVHIHTIADRKVKVLKADGTEGEAMLSQVQARLLVDANVLFAFAEGEVVRSVHDEAINARRASGQADSCEHDGCGRALSMSRRAVSHRSLRPHPWVCRACYRLDVRVAARQRSLMVEAVGLCERGCGRSLNMSPHAVRYRQFCVPRPWACVSCATKEGAAKRVSPACASVNAPKLSPYCISCKEQLSIVDMCAAIDRAQKVGKDLRAEPRGGITCSLCIGEAVADVMERLGGRSRSKADCS
jgi:hypothetical protein